VTRQPPRYEPIAVSDESTVVAEFRVYSQSGSMLALAVSVIGAVTLAVLNPGLLEGR
jgi:hypothetical protein